MPDTPAAPSSKDTSTEEPFKAGQRIYYHGDSMRCNVPVTYEGRDERAKDLFRVRRTIGGRERSILTSRGDLSVDERKR